MLNVTERAVLFFTRGDFVVVAAAAAVVAGVAPLTGPPAAGPPAAGTPVVPCCLLVLSLLPPVLGGGAAAAAAFRFIETVVSILRLSSPSFPCSCLVLWEMSLSDMGAAVSCLRLWFKNFTHSTPSYCPLTYRVDLT